MTYDNTNRGTIAKNTRKTEDSHPDIAGQINVDGKDYWINGWQKTNSRDGSKFYSLSVKPKEARQEQPEQAARRTAANPPDFGGNDDGIPF